MRGKYRPHLILEVVLLSIALAVFPAGNSWADENSKYLDAVREFADNVLKYGRDTYGPKHTPLFVDGLNIHTHEPVKWIDPDGTKWILSNLASQQNLFRTLDGLTKITGDPKYRQAAMEAIKYAFANLRSPNRLLYWGTIAAYDAEADQVYTLFDHHCLKMHYLYYDLMWQVDPEATKRFIEAFWSAHITDWSNLDMDRVASYKEVLEEPWNHEYERGPIFFDSKRGFAPIYTATSLIHAGTALYKFSSQEQPLVWSKRLAKCYVDTRHPNTGISYEGYNQRYSELGNDLEENFNDLRTTYFPYYSFDLNIPFSWPENVQPYSWMGMILVGEMLGEEGEEFTRWGLEELTAWGKASYRRKDNSFVPILTNGTNLEGYVWKEAPGTGSEGLVVKPWPAGMPFFWAYSVAYRTTGDEFMWDMVRDIALGNDFGDIGQTPEHTPDLQTDTICSHVYGLLGFLQLYEKTKKEAYLEMARRIGDNILLSQFHKGFFVASKKHIHTRFDCLEPLALLHLHAAMNPAVRSIPRAWPNKPLLIVPYRHKDWGTDHRVIYALTESPEPPLSLQEAEAIGDINLVRILLENGTDVDYLDDVSLQTALHRAAENGHKSIAELLLAEGADIDAKSSNRNTPLHYAVDKGHKEIAGLLIAKGADVNAKNAGGDTPLHVAVRGGKGKVSGLLIDKGAGVNTRNNEGFTPLHCVAMRPRHSWLKVLLSGDPLRNMAELLISKGADVNATNKEGKTTLWWAEKNGHNGLAALLRKHGAKE